MSFNPIDFLYYNPELQAYSNIVTIEDAQAYYQSGIAGNLVYDTSVIPSNLDPLVFLSTNKDILPLSWMSKTVGQAMSNEGLSTRDIESKSKFATTIFSPVVYTNSNSFTISDYPAYRLDSNNLNIGDDVRIVDSVKTEYLLTVSTLTPSNFVVNTNKYTLLSQSNYVLDGIKLTDPLRMAKLFLARDFPVTFANQQNTLPESGRFNAAMYKLLYPDASSLSDQGAYIDYISKRKNNIFRINNADELLANLVNTSNQVITGVNIDVSSDGSNAQEGASNRLVTEYGIKKFTYNILDDLQTNATFSNVIATNSLTSLGQSTFCNDVTVASNLRVSNSLILTGAATMSNSLYVQGTATFSSNVNINNALVYGNLRISGNMYNARIGIGYWGSNDAYAPSNVLDDQGIYFVSEGSNLVLNGSNVGFGTSNPTEKIDVDGNVKVSQSLYVMGNIGLGLSNPTYQLELSSDSAAKPASATWTVSSDSNLKENIVDADITRCYDIVKNLNLKRYTWKNEFLNHVSVNDTQKLGWIAQEVREVFPKAVSSRQIPSLGEFLTLDSDQIYASMYGCIQKLQHMVEALQEENKEIKASIARLSS